jgi:5-methyltetrahydrofolate--homocysteine methyltransferase
LHGAEARVHELNKVGAEIGREAADASGRQVIVAGSMGPTGEILEPVGHLTHVLAVEMFEEQARGLMDGGADVLWVETISSREEYMAAAEAIGNVGAPWCGTMSFDTAGRTMMGLTAKDMVEMVESLSHKPLAFGANCGVGASDLLRTIVGFSDAKPDLPVIAKSNAGIPKYVDGSIIYDGTPDLMADYAVLALASGAKIIGGCCGTMPEHLEKMRRALESTPKPEKPSLDLIAERLGGFSSESDGSDGAAEPKRRKRRRG